MTKHTPGPWKTKHGLSIRAPDDKELAEMIRDWDIAFEAQANAEFIVRACNSHYELLEALKEGKSEFDRMFHDIEMSVDERHSFIPVINKMNETIRKAEGAS